MQLTDMTEEERNAVENIERCPSCGTSDIAIMHDLKTNRYYARCHKCEGRFNVRADFDSVICAVDVWNLCSRMVSDMILSEKSENVFVSETTDAKAQGTEGVA